MEIISLIKISIAVFVVVFNVILALFVYRNNPKSATNKTFGILGLLISIWIITMHISGNPLMPLPTLLFWTRMSIFIAAPMSFSFFLLAHTIPHRELQPSRKLFYIWGFITVAVMAVNISPYAFTAIEIVENSPKVSVGLAMVPFAVLSTFFSAGAIYVLIKKSLRSTGSEKRQLGFVLTGIFFMLGLIISTIFIPVLFFHNASFVSFAPLYTLLFLTMTAYAIVKHGLLDIRIFLARAISFLVFIILCAAVYTLVFFIIARTIFSIRMEISTVIGLMVFTVVAALTFQPVYASIRRVTNRVFFKGQYNSDRLLAELTRIMAQTIDLGYMTKTILNLLIKEVRVSKAAFLIIDQRKITEIMSVKYEEKKLAALKLEQLFSKYFKTQPRFVFEDLPEGRLKKIFRKFDIAIAIPVKVEKVEVAILILGNKLSGEIYSQADMNFLNVFASEAGIAIQNAKSYEEIKKFSKELEKRVEERTHELKESQERELAKAQDIAKLKDEFVFIAAHELRTPVTAIRGFLELVSSASATKSFPKDVQENLNFMAEASEHLNQLINDLLEISRSEAETMKIAVRPVDMCPIIQSIIKETSLLADRRRVKIILEKHGSCIAMVDDQKIKEVIMNLVSNAVKYNRDGGKVDINVFPVENDLMVEVRDSGYGIPKDQQDKIFQKFFRASGKKTEEVLGTGLGLFITRMLVEKMGGKITFSSIEGEGCTFAVFLPLAVV